MTMLCKQSNSQEHKICGLLPAAGLSRRMGSFKPLLPLGKKTVIETAVDSLLSAGASQVVIVLGHRGEEIREVLGKDAVIFAENPDYARTDMLTSIQIGLRAMPCCDAFFLLPADMPLVSRDTCEKVKAAMPWVDNHIVFPAVDGYRKHPPLISAGLIPDILTYRGADGLRGFWKEEENCIVTVPVTDTGCCTDLDTPLQYQNCVAFYDNANTK